MGGGITLPTASTPGYGYFTDKNTGRKHVACYHLIQFLTAAEKLGLARGLIKVGLDIVQLVGGAEASGNTHLCGSAYDVKQVSDPWLRIFREMGSAFWPRLDDLSREDDLWDDNQHGHGTITCAHDACNEYQMTAYWRGYSGLGKATSGPYAGMWGYGSKDPNPWRPSVRRTVAEGLAWAEAQTKAATQPAPTPVPEEDDMAMTKEDAFTLWTARKWNEYADEDGSGSREARTPIDVLFATHKAALLAASPNVDAIVEGVVARISPNTGALTTDQIRSATADGVRDFFDPLVNKE